MNFRSGAAHARNAGTTVPYPRPQNIWIACDTANPRHSFENLYMKVRLVISSQLSELIINLLGLCLGHQEGVEAKAPLSGVGQGVWSTSP